VSALALDGVVKRHGDVLALDGVSLVLQPGQVLALLGPNGAGKSTLVSLAAGLAAPDAGTVRVGGDDPWSGGATVRRCVGVAPQEIGVYPTLTVEQNLRAFGELCGLAPRAARARAGELVDAFALSELRRRLAAQLSGGEQRRLHAAIALVARPPLVLLDEPTAGADAATRERLLATVRALADDDGVAVLYTTHYLPEVERLRADVVRLERGRVATPGPAAA
jgi:ABC-2 type transport system ATP-binding protein